MRLGDRFPADQAEVVLSEVFLEQVENQLSSSEAEEVMAAIVRLCAAPGGSHPLRAPLSGWNTLEVLRRTRRVVYHARTVDGQGLIDVICLGPRAEAEVYDVATGLRDSGLISDETFTQIWEALSLLDIVAEEVGLNGWDYRPQPAPEGMMRAAVAGGLFENDTVHYLSKDELEVAFEHGWDATGNPDPAAAFQAALLRRRSSSVPDGERVLEHRKGARCGEFMPRAKASCIRVADHPGPHRAR